MNFVCKNLTIARISEIAKSISEIVMGGDIFVLVGEIGTGKTTFVSHIVKEMNSTIDATSPTFAIVAEYPLIKPIRNIQKIVHVDTYRLVSVNELYDLGLETIFDENAVTFIEWGEKIEDHIDKNHFSIFFEETSPEVRDLCFKIKGEIDNSRLEAIKQTLLQSGWYSDD